MKPFTYCLVLSGLLTLSMHAKGQTIRYDYDASGNRAHRVIVLSAARQAAAPETPEVHEDKVGTAKVTIYPNPTASLLRIDIAEEDGPSVPAANQGPATVTLLSVSGVVLRTVQLSGNTATLDLSAYSTGVYLVKIQKANLPVSAWRVIKE